MKPERPGKPVVLCVDDETAVLEGLALHLRRRFDVLMATSGSEGLATLQQNPGVAIVMSDMRMPAMDGATFLTQARELAPDATRILLTGHADIQSAAAAINNGRIFRFLTKPCPPSDLLAAFESAMEQHRLVTSERVLLQQTLHGSIAALSDVLALTSPAAFGRANRVKQLVTAIATAMELKERWQVEVAAMLSSLGTITLPPETAERVSTGHALSDAERKMVGRAAGVTDQLLANIPRLEVVRAILSASEAPPRPAGAVPSSVVNSVVNSVVDIGAQILRVASDFDALTSRGDARGLAFDTLIGRAGHYDRAVLNALDQALSGIARDVVREVPLASVRVGMAFADDVRMVAGGLLVARGYEVTSSFVERVRNFAPGVVREPVRVRGESHLFD